MVTVAQSVRASDCGSEGCGFDSRQSPCIGVIMIFCFDIDNTICENRIGDMTYADVKPFSEALETLQCDYFQF